MLHKEAAIREPLILGHKTYGEITEDIVKPIENPAPKAWYIMITVAGLVALWGIGCVIYLLGTGVGVWGLNKTIGWAWDITNFVWWVGIGHAGTLISAVLLLFRQKWRMAINRSAEAMTIFAVMMAALFPGIHMGRIWVAYWVLPLPNQFGSLWVNFNSPLLWDVFAISTYFTVSLVFWYIGLIPDFATIRDRLKKPLPKKVYSILSFGWSGNAKAWNRFEIVSLVLAGIATPLVFSVHSIVSMDFATSVVPGWHTTIFPPYFVSGAVFSGFAMVLTLLLVMRKAMNLENYITVKHVEYMNIVIIVTGSIVGVAYLSELFISWYSGVEYESYAFINRATGDYWWAYFWMMTCNVVSPQLFWIKKIRTNLSATFVLSIFINVGMWFERFVIIMALNRDFVPSSWSMFYPTFVDIGIFLGTIGIFFTLFLLFARFFPVLALNELKTILKSSGEYYKGLPQDHPLLTGKKGGDSDDDPPTDGGGIGGSGGPTDSPADPAPEAAPEAANEGAEEAPADDAPATEPTGDDGPNPEAEATAEAPAEEPAAEAPAEEAPAAEEETEVDAPSVDADEAPIDIDAAKAALMGAIGSATAAVADDLKKISGVGPVLEEKLNELGIYNYEQVSKMTKTEYDLLDKLTGSFPGRAERDDWAGQAAKMNEEKNNN